jgi:demethylmenaquinone methyltransferase/2-methoxy-6-polyprenyl-1,4-benzoquinol methylase
MKKTHFGFREIPEEEKKEEVKAVFSRVATRYDLMNDVMSVGLHHLWKRFAIAEAGLRNGDIVLDCAGGTGDMTRLATPKVMPKGKVVLADINHAMLLQDKSILCEAGLLVPLVQCDGERLPFKNRAFSHVICAFGLRNMTHIDDALQEFSRVLRPGGKALILEFSKIWEPLSPIYDFYSFHVIPKLGDKIANDKESYQYLVESIRKHPDHDTLASMMRQNGFDDVKVYRLTAGIVALHVGYVW